MAMWAAVYGALVLGFSLGVIYAGLLHIAKREDTEAQSFAAAAHPARIVR